MGEEEIRLVCTNCENYFWVPVEWWDKGTQTKHIIYDAWKHIACPFCKSETPVIQ